MKIKNIIFSIILLFLFMPFIVNAKDGCTIISGNGKDIGSEIACGTEHFYVINSTDTETKMLSKYNILVGDKISYFDINESFTYVNDNIASEYCLNLATEKGYEPYITYPISEYNETDNNYILT